MSLAGGDDGAAGYLVPLIAIAPGDENAGGYVFKFDPDAGAVSKVAIIRGRGPGQHDRGQRRCGGR